MTISSLTQGIPAGNNILPYSTGSSTLGVPVSAILQNAGNVGIGIDNPVRRLEVNGAIKSYSAGGNLIFNSDSGYEWWTGSWNDFVSYQVTRRKISDGEGTSHLTINTSGNVGIGTITPSTKLDVNGTIKATALQVPGTVIQVKQAVKRDVQTYAEGVYGAITNLSIDITPRALTSTFMLMGTISVASVIGQAPSFRFLRNNTDAIGVGTAEGNRYAATTWTYVQASNFIDSVPINFLDSTALSNLNSVNYKIQVRGNNANNGEVIWINSNVGDTNASNQARCISTLTVWEIAG